MKRLTPSEVSNRIKSINSDLILVEETYINTSTKCKFIERGYGEFWCRPNLILSKKQKGHPDGTKDKIKETCKEKYGTESPFQDEKIKNKIKESLVKKYGISNPMELEEFKHKKENTCKNRYGTDNPMKNAEIKEKAKRTNLKKYGASSPLKNPEILSKMKNTNLNRYGHEYTCQVPEIKETQEKTNLKKYGHVNPFGNKDIQEKAQKSFLENMTDATYSSKGEIEVKEFIESLGFKTEKIVIPNSNKEVDIFIPEKNIAIEYNGDFWHSEWNKKITKNYHLNKTILALKEGISLIHIFESEWESKKSQFKKFLKAKLGIRDRVVYARKCIVREVDTETAKVFLEENHIRGKVRSFLRLGLYYNDELLTLVTLSNPHRQNMGNLPCLSRLCTKDGVQVIGGLSRLSRKAFKEVGPFITFTERQRSEGQSYIKAGYKVVKTLPPDYFYTKRGKFISKQSRSKRAVNTPKGMTEKEHARVDGLYRVWDCGKYKFIYDGE